MAVKMQRWIVLLVLIVILAGGCGRTAGRETAGKASVGPQTTAQALLGDWVPYRAEDTPLDALAPYRIDVPYATDVNGPTNAIVERIEGFPANYPYDLLPPLAVSSVSEASDEDGDCFVFMDSAVSYEEAARFYRTLLSDKASFKEFNDYEGEVSFYALVSTWEVGIRVTNWREDGLASVEIHLFDVSAED